MSELQIGLLAIGVLVVVGVYGYGYWQQRQYRQKYGAAFKAEREDVLYQAAPGAANTGMQPVLADEDALALESIPSQRASADDEACRVLEEAIDYVVEMTLKKPLGSDVLAPLWGRRFDFGKRVNACGLNVATQRWERLIPESHPSYSQFKIGVQLADRSGPVSQSRLNDFHDILREIAEQLQADVVLPAQDEALSRAKILDAFCAEVDQMIGLNIVPNGERLLFGSEVAQAAESHGFKLQADGTFHWVDVQGLTLFSLSSLDAASFQHHTLTQMRVPGLTLLLDVPRVERPVERFDAMALLARELALDLRAGVVDDHRVVLGETAIAHIREQVAVIEQRMLAGQVVPGSAQALRLFS